MSNRLTLRGLEVFVAAVVEGSLGAAAKRLRLSPSTVSQQLSNLEAALGARLIERGVRPLTLTPAGLVFHDGAQATLDELVKARAELTALDLARLPRLRLAIVDDFDSDTTPDVAFWLGSCLPGSVISLHTGASHENLDALGHRQVDIVVAADQDDAPDWVESHGILRDPYVVVAAPGLLGGVRDPAALLARTPMVRFSTEQFIGRQIERQLRRMRITPPRQFEFDATHALLGGVERTQGWSLITALCWLRAPRFHVLLEVAPSPFPALSRNLAVFARRGALGDLPAQLAEKLRGLLATNAVAPGVAKMPWLDGQLRIFGELPDPQEVRGNQLTQGDEF